MPDSARDLVLDDRSGGGRLVTADGQALPLQEVTLSAEARGGLARAVLEQRFVNPHTEPLRVSYLVPLPADGAVAGYAIRVGDRRIVGEVDRIQAARERFETALIEGRSAGLVDQERPSLFTLELGNVPPGAEVVAELTIDQRLAWLDEGAWEWRFPTVVAPRYLGGEGRVPDAEQVTVDVVDAPVTARASVTLLVRDALTGGRTPLSPSHALAVEAEASGWRVRIDAGLDRDLVVRWRTAGTATTPALQVARPPAGHARAGSAYGLLTLAPPAPEAHAAVVPRDLILLLDTSGSMAGEPLGQARTMARALVQGLSDVDRLEMIAFASRPRRWRGHAERVTETTRRAALAWLEGLAADGGTEMLEGVVAALRPLRPDAQRQVVLITDGLIGFEGEIVGSVARELPAGSRLHTVGVGASVNRGLTAPAARAGRGLEIVLGLDEAVAPAVNRLLAATQAPLLVDVTLSGSALRAHAPAALPDVCAGAPLRAALELSPEGGDLLVRGRTATGDWVTRMTVPALSPGEGTAAVVSLYGREAVEDLSVRRAIGDEAVDADTERLGLDFQIATPRTSWVAVAEERSVDPTQPTRRQRMPHALPHGLSVEALGLRRTLSLKGSFSGPSSRYDAVLSVRGVALGPGLDALAFLRVPAAPGTLRLTARLVRRQDRELTFEITAPLAMEWAPAEVVVFFPERAGVRADIVEAASTARGRIRAGVTLRLSVVLAEEGLPTTPAEIGMFLSGVLVRVPVRA